MIADVTGRFPLGRPTNAMMQTLQDRTHSRLRRGLQGVGVGQDVDLLTVLTVRKQASHL